MNYEGLLAGLGNPGPRYAATRHNYGFSLADALLDKARQDGQTEALSGGKFSCELWRARLPELGGWWLVAKPQTFMNLSGQSVQPLLAWHRLTPDRLVVAHDELDIPAGQLRFKRGGGNAGHNGLKSITEQLGTPDFYRLRLGIGRPPHQGEVTNWVLGRPDAADAALMATALPLALRVFFTFAGKGLEAATRLARQAGAEPGKAAKPAAPPRPTEA